MDHWVLNRYTSIMVVIYTIHITQVHYLMLFAMVWHIAKMSLALQYMGLAWVSTLMGLLCWASFHIDSSMFLMNFRMLMQ